MDLAKVTELTGLGRWRAETNEFPLYCAWSTPPEGPYHLLLPEHLVPDFENAVQLLDTRDKISWHRYQVAPGDSLGAIANRFNTEIQVFAGHQWFRRYVYSCWRYLAYSRCIGWQYDVFRQSQH